MKHIGVIDCNNFFCSCERLFRPDLKKKPVVVLSSNDGCVVARSNEVKALGIPMGVPYFKVKKELEAANAAVFSSNFTLYRDISRRVMTVMKERLSVIEQYSVDEAFFEIEGEGERLLEILKDLKQALETEVGIPVSIGIGKTKTIAKYAVEKNKRTIGLCILEGETWKAETTPAELTEIWGIGRQTTTKLRQHGLITVADLLQADSARVDRLFGIEGIRKREELAEKSVYRVAQTSGASKSIMSTRSFKATTNDRRVVEDALAYHVAHAAAELRATNQKARFVQIIARPSRHSDWALRQGGAERYLDVPTNDTRLLLRVALELLDTFFDTHVPYKKAGVVLGGFTDATIEQVSLFAPVNTAGAALMNVLDTLNQRFGSGTLTVGAQGMAAKWQSSREHVSPSYTTKWSDLPVIKS